MATPPTDPPADRITELLHRELRTARSAAMDEGSSPEEITADLTERVRKLRRLNDSGWRPGAPPPDTEPAQDAPLPAPPADDAPLRVRDDPRRP